MTVSEPEPLPPAPSADAVPASPYTAAPVAPAAPTYAPAPVMYTPAPVDPRRDKNPFGIVALVLAIVSYLIPAGFLVAPIVASMAAGGEIGWAVLGGLIFAVIGLVPGAGVALIAVILAIVSLVRSNRKALGIVTLVLTAPLVLFGLLMLPAVLGGNFF